MERLGRGTDRMNALASFKSLNGGGDNSPATLRKEHA